MTLTGAKKLLYENFEGDLTRPIDDLVKDSDTLAMRSDEIRMVGCDWLRQQKKEKDPW
jgi:hypothetical protein